MTGFKKIVTSSTLNGKLLSVIDRLLLSVNATQDTMKIVWAQDLGEEITPPKWTRIIPLNQAFSANVDQYKLGTS